MYKFNTKINGLKNVPSYISEISFNPKGNLLAASYAQFDNKDKRNNKVRLYNVKSKKVIFEFSNPTSKLNHPHAILLTDNHLLVTNKGDCPNSILTFNIKNKSRKPLQIYSTPFKHLNEAHSLALFNNILVVTYCERLSKKGSLVSYDFDNKKGVIKKPLDILEKWFEKFGDAKGVSFHPKGNKIYITFTSDFFELKDKLKWLVKKIISLNAVGTKTKKTGIAIFAINKEGKFSSKPEKIYLFNNSRLENIHISGGKCLVTDTINNSAYIFDLNQKRKFHRAREIITENLYLPHGGKISPNRELVAISNFGLYVKENKYIQWGKFLPSRKDCISIFRLE